MVSSLPDAVDDEDATGSEVNLPPSRHGVEDQPGQDAGGERPIDHGHAGFSAQDRVREFRSVRALPAASPNMTTHVAASQPMPSAESLGLNTRHKRDDRLGSDVDGKKEKGESDQAQRPPLALRRRGPGAARPPPAKRRSR